jgi:hypothetical protein
MGKVQRGFVDEYEPRGSDAVALRLTCLWVGEVIPLRAAADSMWMWASTSEDTWVESFVRTHWRLLAPTAYTSDRG